MNRHAHRSFFPGKQLVQVYFKPSATCVGPCPLPSPDMFHPINAAQSASVSGTGLCRQWLGRAHACAVYRVQWIASGGFPAECSLAATPQTSRAEEHRGGGAETGHAQHWEQPRYWAVVLSRDLISFPAMDPTWFAQFSRRWPFPMQWCSRPSTFDHKLDVLEH